MLKAAPRQKSLELMPVLEEYSAAHDLPALLACIRHDEPAASPLSQKDYVAFMRPEYQPLIAAKGRRAAKWFSADEQYETVLRAMLVITAHFMQHAHYDAQMAPIGGGEGGGRNSHRLAPPKTYARITTKARSDHAALPPPLTGWNLDVCRRSICSPSAADQLAVRRCNDNMMQHSLQHDTRYDMMQHSLQGMSQRVHAAQDTVQHDATPFAARRTVQGTSQHMHGHARNSACARCPWQAVGGRCGAT